MIENYKNGCFLFIVFSLAVLLSSCGGSVVVKTTGNLYQPTVTPTASTQVLQVQVAAHTVSNTPPMATQPPTGTHLPTTTPISTQPPSASVVNSGHFTTLPAGSSLPSDAECTARVRLSTWEPRPDNTTANHTNVYAQGSRLTGSYLKAYAGYEQKVTGNFSGTTDEIIQWGACKWGIDEDIVRAQAEMESHWHQSTLGDCLGGTVALTHGCQSVGILQVKGANLPPTHPGTWPYAYQSTAFNADYMLAVLRSCFEGKETWLGNGYHAGDIWGCVGRWFSGDWYGGSLNYIASVKNNMANKDWLQAGF